MTQFSKGRRTKAGLTVGLAAALVAAAAGCGSSSGTSGDVKDPALVRAAAPATLQEAPPADLAATAGATTAFGLDVYRALTEGDDGNLAVAPSSLASALAMLAPGARGRTASEMSAALHTRLPADRFAAAMGALGRGTQEAAAAGKMALRQSDTVWLQQGYSVRKGYLDLLASTFDTGVRVTDFKAAPEQSRRQVNSLVEQQTEGHIKDLFGAGSFTGDTRLVLTDALYLKADWQKTFDKSGTHDAPFHRLDGSAPGVSTMQQTNQFRYASGNGWQAVELPYQGGRLAMDVLLPKAGSFTAFRESLDSRRLAGISAEMSDTSVDLALPKFTFDSTGQMDGALRSLGMRSAFEPGQADFGAIPTNARDRLFVQAVRQKVHVAVDEKGTTAAAASGIGIGITAARSPVTATPMHVDRPFVFLIRDVDSGQTLFLGQVTDPH